MNWGQNFGIARVMMSGQTCHRAVPPSFTPLLILLFADFVVFTVYLVVLHFTLSVNSTNWSLNRVWPLNIGWTVLWHQK